MAHGVEPGIELQHVGEDLVVELALAFFGKGVGLHDLLLILHQLLCGETLAVDQGLLAVEVGRDLGDLPLGDLKVIAEDPVVSELEDRQTAVCLHFLKIILQDRVAVVADIALVVQILIVAWEYHLPFLELAKALVVDCPVNAVHQSGAGTQGILVHRGLQKCQITVRVGGNQAEEASDCLLNAHKVMRHAAPEHHTGHKTVEVHGPAQCLAHPRKLLRG